MESILLGVTGHARHIGASQARAIAEEERNSGVPGSGEPEPRTLSAEPAYTLAESGFIIGFPASSAMRIPSSFTGARRKTSSPSAAEIAFSTAQQPAATGGSPMPRAPTGVSGSGSSTAAQSMCLGASRIVGGLL